MSLEVPDEDPRLRVPECHHPAGALHPRAPRPGRTTCASTSSIAASAIPTCTRPAANGTASSYPCVPGHEIVGRVTAVGAEVTKFKVGDLVGVGCMVDSCPHCQSCDDGLEQYCDERLDRHLQRPGPMSAAPTPGRLFRSHRGATRTSCSRSATTKELAAVAPLLCAGITTVVAAAATGRSARARRSASSASAASATWA